VAKRRRGLVRGAVRDERRAREFERLVDRALAAIPDPFRGALAEVAIVIEDEPTDRQLLDNGLSLDESMFGLYEGVPRTEWASDWAMSPNKITLFRGPLEAEFRDPRELEAEVRRTVVHELGHHLGIDDDRLEELGAG
jgi:predicted Zn-dependent protease with MMP-like domain